MHDGDVGMVQLGEGQSFLAEALAGGFVGEGIGRQDLQGDIPVQMLIPGAVHFAHPAATQLLDNAIPGDCLANH